MLPARPAWRPAILSFVAELLRRGGVNPCREATSRPNFMHLLAIRAMLCTFCSIAASQDSSCNAVKDGERSYPERFGSPRILLLLKLAG
jgi:hypothetical protein